MRHEVNATNAQRAKAPPVVISVTGYDVGSLYLEMRQRGWPHPDPTSDVVVEAKLSRRTALLLADALISEATRDTPES